MAKNGLIVPIGRSAGYAVYGQSRDGQYPQITLPKEGGVEVGGRVRYFRVEIPGAVLLAAGDIVIRKMPDPKET